MIFILFIIGKTFDKIRSDFWTFPFQGKSVVLNILLIYTINLSNTIFSNGFSLA